MHQLSTSLRNAAEGKLEIVAIEGDAGIGKTRLVDETLRRAEALGMTVLVGAADQLFRSRPFGVFADALVARRAEESEALERIAYLLTPRMSDSAKEALLLEQLPEIRFELVEELVAFFENAARSGPVALALEDLQWADSSTLVVLKSLARRSFDLPLALILTFRSSPRSADLDLLLEDLFSLGGMRLVVGPLDEAAVAELAAAVTGAPAGSALVRRLQGAGGNPFFILELLKALEAEDALECDVHAGTRSVELPPSLRLTVLRRLSILSPEAIELLTLGSILGSTFTLNDLSLVSGRSAAELLAPVKDALSAGILGEAGDRLAFRHDLVRSAVYEDLPVTVRKRLHLEAGRALATAGAGPDVVAQHLSLGASEGDADAIEWLHKAARGLAPQSPDTAADLLRRAIELCSPSDPAIGRLHADLVVATAESGRLPEAAELARAVLSRLDDPSLATAVHVSLIETLLRAGRMIEANAEIQVALGQKGEESDAAWRRLRAEAAWGPVFVGDLSRAREAAQEARRLGEQHADDIATCIALNVLSGVATLEGKVDEAVAFGEASLSRGRHSGVREAGRLTQEFFLGLALTAGDRFPEAEEQFQRGLRRCERDGMAWTLALYHVSGLAELRFLSGQWEDALADVGAGLALAEEVGSKNSVIAAHIVTALVAFHRNDLRETEHALVRAEGELATWGVGVRLDWLLWARALLAEAQGDRAVALAALENAWQVCGVAGAAVSYPVLGPDLVRLAVEGGLHAQARSVSDAVDLAAAHMGTPSSQGAALRCRGLLEANPDVLLTAVAAYRAGPRPLALAHSLEDAGTALGRIGRGAEAVSHLEEAVEVYEHLGAARDCARAENSLRQLGVRRGKRGTRRRPAKGWESLTDTERRVVALAIEGLTRRQIGERLFISPRTVETHLSHVLKKLGVSSRVELVAAATRRTSNGSDLASA